VEYTIKRELVQILGEIEQQLGELSKPVRGFQARLVYLTGDIEKIISDKYAELTDAQKYSVSDKMRIQRISTTY
jgi:hypothetical protein